MSDQLSGAILLVIVAVIILRKLTGFYGAPVLPRHNRRPAAPGRARTRRRPPVDDYWSDAPRARQQRPERSPVKRAPAPARRPRPAPPVEPADTEREGLIQAFIKEHKFARPLAEKVVDRYIEEEAAREATRNARRSLS